ncbi:hypothetical protein M426DRAFT_7683 [Hypoxylon sp. CI-4A]|nr:hypothetical protein M426DRAFT_7683 [Hypoxylon sp. CI-4A]
MAPGRRYHTLPHRRNSMFVGRANLLDEIHGKIRGERSSGALEPVSCLLKGLGGIGKTQVALEYCYERSEDYNWQFWITAETSTKLYESFCRIAEKLPREAQIGEDVIGDVLYWFETTGDTWLIIFDNVEDWACVYDQYVPTACKNRSAMILTSQLTAIDSEIHHVFLIESLSIDDGERILAKYVHGKDILDDPEEKEAAREISRRFSGLPLALAQIAGFVSATSISLVEYDKIFDGRCKKDWEGNYYANRQYEKSMEAVWDVALSESQLSPNARKLIQIMAFLDPDKIPKDILLQSYREDPGWCVNRGSEEADLSDRNNNEDTFFTIHRSLQHAILLQLDQDPTKRGEVFLQAFNAIRHVTPKANVKQIPTPSRWPQFEIAIPHIISLCNKYSKSRPRMQGTVDLARLLYDGGFYLWEQEDRTEDSIHILNTALGILNEVHNTNDRLRADILAILGMCYDRRGPDSYEKSRRIRNQVRQIRQAIKEREIEEENVSPITSLLLYNSINDLGIAEMQFNQLQIAEQLFEQCFKMYQIWGFDEDIPFEYAKYYHNMGMVRMCQGKFPDAIKFLKKAVFLEEQHEKSRKSRVIWYDYDLACAIFHAGDSDEALKLHLKILNEREAQSGKYGEMTLQSYYTVGAMYHHLGILDKAIRYMEECVNRASTVGRKRWPECALGRARMHLSRLLKETFADPKIIEPHENFGKAILDKYRNACELFTPRTDDDMILYDSLQPVFDGRFTGRDLLPLLQTTRVDWRTHNLPT